jgi:hypothetical protein
MIFIWGITAVCAGWMVSGLGRKTLGDALTTAGLSLVGTSFMLLLIGFMP